MPVLVDLVADLGRSGVLSPVKSQKFLREAVGSIGLLVMGCSPAPPGETAGIDIDIDNGTAMKVDLREHQRIGAFIDGRYLRSDVRHSFTTKLGQPIDCVEFLAAPQVKALAMAGQPMAGPDPVQPVDMAARSEYELNGAPDDQGAARTCPEGTVPEIRLTEADILGAGGLDAFQSASRRLGRHFADHQSLASRQPAAPASGPSALPQGGLSCTQPFGVDYPGYAHVQRTYQNSNITNAASYLSINEPAVPRTNPNAASRAQVWMYSGIGVNGLDGCSCAPKGVPSQPNFPSCAQTIEAGWDVESWWKKNFHPVFFIFSTNNGYSDPSSCWDASGSMCPTGAPAWVPAANAGLIPGQLLPVTSSAGPHELYISVQISGGKWSIRAGIDGAGSVIGSFSAGSFWGSMATSGSQIYQVGGETSDPDLGGSVEMGTGVRPSTGWGIAAYVRDINVKNGATALAPAPPQTGVGADGMVATVPDSYTWSTLSDNTFFYGSDAGVFSNQHYHYQPPPNLGDWSPNNWKGQCKVNLTPVPNVPASVYHGEPMTGLSAASWGNRGAHALKCAGGDFYQRTYFGFCYAKSFGPGVGNACGSSCTGANDWDPSYYKASCNPGDVVYGVAQGAAGDVKTILCCPADGTGSSCATEIVYGQSQGFSGHDWDYGFYKSQCASGKFVNGISSLTTAPAGAPHAIRCCGP
jgi:hypothetical protein